MREGLKKKRKSIIHSIEQTNVKNFKSFVRSKILSKSNINNKLVVKIREQSLLCNGQDFNGNKEQDDAGCDEPVDHQPGDQQAVTNTVPAN